MSKATNPESTRAYLTVTLVLLAAGTYAWVLSDQASVYDYLSADFGVLFQEPWRVITSPFIHKLAPHAIFNVLTLWVFGRRVETRHGARVFVSAFFGSLFVGHVLHTAVHGHFLIGISGGVCGLYGFLLRMDKKPTLRETLTQDTWYWVYPASMLLLLVVDFLGLYKAAHLNHFIGIAFGYIVALSLSAGRGRLLWQAVAATLTAIAFVLTIYRPWDIAWQAIYGVVSTSARLPQISCDEKRRPAGDVRKNDYVLVTVLDRSERQKRIYYIDPEGKKVLDGRSRRKLFTMRPYLGSVWRVEEDSGSCLAQFEVGKGGLVEIEVGNR